MGALASKERQGFFMSGKIRRAKKSRYNYLLSVVAKTGVEPVTSGL